MIIDVFLPLSLVFIMFTLGLGLTLDDFINLIHRPKAFFVGIMNQMILLPVVAFFSISLMGITKELAVGMMILASCPGGVTSKSYLLPFFAQIYADGRGVHYCCIH